MTTTSPNPVEYQPSLARRGASPAAVGGCFLAAGLGLMVVGGCFLVGVLLMYRSVLMFRPMTPPGGNAIAGGGELTLLVVLYALAGLSFAGAVAFFILGTRILLRGTR
jgi:hypothetical protein